ncbi:MULTISPECIES: MFS transporter [Kitasatospora]|uniref:Putative drug resistance protein n=1 Tax=Kitasatospora setae (strain ATCC 33774 / DSM 43861 / JCM 3304 / KCC A-0304 / NBRC 14216 / KM-6054) TaxID=452652 RepID=E4N4H5_KITSK|nr:MFS transporter [Kitasatospora setae]BAJ26106.1 putative drug resistance protein [Kitasatospora setae KM-6054]
MRGFRLLVLGQAASEFGNAFQAVALPMLVYSLGGGTGQLSAVVSAFGIGRLAAAPLGGICADRWGARRVMLAADLGRLAATAALAVAALRHLDDLLLIGTLTCLVGLGAGLFLPASWAVVPDLLPADDLQAGNALSSTVNHTAGLLGPPLAGAVLLWLDPGTGLVVDAATFAVSALTLLLIGRTGERTREDPGADRATGFLALLRGSRMLRGLLAVTVVTNLTVGGMTRIGLPALATGDFAAGAVGFGALLAAFTGGCLLGGPIAAALDGVRHRGRTAGLAALLMGLAVALVPFAGLPGALVALLVAGVACTVNNVLLITGVQHRTPPALLARVMAALTFCALCAFPLSALAVGAVVTAFGTPGVFVVTGLTMLAATGITFTVREVREM